MIKYIPKIMSYSLRHQRTKTAEIFVDKIEEDVRKIFNEFKFDKKISIRKDEKKAFKESTNCHNCKQLFEEGDKR